MDRFTAMSVFVRVVEAGNFSKAADSLDMPKPTVTRMIQALEAGLKVKLLQRTTRSVNVTPEGATYYERVVLLLADLAEIEASTTQALVRPSGRIRVEAAVALGTQVLVPALPSFYEAYPDIEIEFGIGNRTPDMFSEGVDCAIRVGEIAEQSLIARHIGNFRFVSAATPRYLKRNGTPSSPNELSEGHTLVGLVSPESTRPLAFEFLKDGEHIEVEPKRRLLLTDTNAYLAAGLAGVGIVQAPSFAVHPLVAQGRLVEVLPDWRTPIVPISIVYAPNRYMSAKVRVFIDWVLALFKRDPQLQIPQ